MAEFFERFADPGDMKSWLDYMKNGLGRKRSKDRFASPEAPAGLSVKALYRRFFPFLKKFKKRFVVGAGLVSLTAALSLPLPLISRFLIDEVIIARKLSLLAGTIAVMLGLMAANRLLNLYQQHYFERFHRKIILDIQSDLLARVFHYPKAFFDKTQTGYLMSRIEGDVEKMGWLFSGTMVEVVENLFRFAGGLIFLGYLDWRLALIVVVIIPGVVVLVRYFSDKLNTLSNESMESQAIVSSRLQEDLSSIALIKAFAAEDKTLHRLMESLKKALHVSLEESAINALANMVIASLPGIARAAVLVIGAYWVITGHWSLGSLFAFQAYLAYVFEPAQILATANLQMSSALASAERIANLFDLVPKENAGHGKIAIRLAGTIEFQRVSFSYDPAVPILEEISFAVRPGERIAIVGESGVGKTTLVSLILGFYRPTGGEILFDGQPASFYEVGSLRERLGYVPQQNWLLSESIMDNIRYGNPAAGMDEVFKAARNAGIHDFIKGLPEGYRTEVGERGVSLSEGQRQRICIARALLKAPDILLLDEPTSALDGQTGRSLLLSLPPMFKEKTVLIVSNHWEWIKEVDRILVLRGTRLEATGTPEGWLSRNPDNAALVIGTVGIEN
jgi:subfamily B ATP-binding cassette protein MsbA